MQPIRGRGKWKVNRRGHGHDGRRGHGRDGEGGRGTPEPTLPTSIPPHTYPSPDIFIPPQTYTAPSIPSDTYTSLLYLVLLESAFIAIYITLSSYPLSSPTLPPIGDTIIDLVSEFGALPARQPRSSRICRVLHSSTPSAPSTPSATLAPFEIARDPIDQLVMYYRLLREI